jgi:ABC-type Mn2+/Zn2+ transport system ATPase subunit
MRDFSGGQKKKVLIARSLCEKAHLLVWETAQFHRRDIPHAD